MNLFKFIKKVFEEFNEDKATQLSAAFAYIAIFAIGPLLLVLISIVGFIYGDKASSGELFSQLSGIVGERGAKSVQDAIAQINQSGSGAIALIIGAAGTLLAASGLSNQLQNSFDVIFDAVVDPKTGIKRTIYTKIKNVLILIGAGFVATISIIVSTVVASFGENFQDDLGVPAFVLELLNAGVSLMLFISILYLIYKVLPDVHIPNKVALSAAAAISVLFLAGKMILGIIIARNATASAYGAAASVIILLLWFYYTAQILLLGAEGIKVYGDNHGLVYKAKKYTLKRKTVNLDLKDDFLGRLIEKFAQGYKSKRKSDK